MYAPTKWEDHVSTLPGIVKLLVYDEAKNFYRISEAGEVMVPGTPQDQTNFNNMEDGILDAHIATSLLLNYARQLEWSLADVATEDLQDFATAFSLLLNYARQTAWRTDALETATVQEVGTVSLTNSQHFPFNNSQKSVALENRRDNTNYVVVITAVTGTGNIGEIEVTDRLVNGFKIRHTGSANAVTVTYAVIGGYDK